MVFIFSYVVCSFEEYLFLYQDNFELIRRLGEFKALGYPILLGTSRKSFIGQGLQDSQIDRKIGSITSIVSGILNGAKIVRA